VKVGKVKFVGRVPVVNVREVEVVPSLRTYLMRYVVLGSMPVTRKLVLSPGTIDPGEVLSHVGLDTSGLYWTYIELPEEGGALNRAMRGLEVELTTGLEPVIRVLAV
jgi:hypothetical protein